VPNYFTSYLEIFGRDAMNIKILHPTIKMINLLSSITFFPDSELVECIFTVQK